MALTKKLIVTKATIYRDADGNICLDVQRDTTVTDAGTRIARGSTTSNEYTTLTATHKSQLTSILEALEG